jgi:hypothetical protein
MGAVVAAGAAAASGFEDPGSDREHPNASTTTIRNAACCTRMSALLAENDVTKA